MGFNYRDMRRTGQDRQEDCSCSIDNACHKRDFSVGSFKTISTLPIKMFPRKSIKNIYKSMEELSLTSEIRGRTLRAIMQPIATLT